MGRYWLAVLAPTRTPRGRSSVGASLNSGRLDDAGRSFDDAKHDGNPPDDPAIGAACLEGQAAVTRPRSLARADAVSNEAPARLNLSARDVERARREISVEGRGTRVLELVLNTSRPRSDHDRSDGTLGPVPGDPQSDAIRVGRDHDPSRVRRRR